MPRLGQYLNRCASFSKHLSTKYQMLRLIFLSLLLVVLSIRGYCQLDTTSNAYVHNKDSLAISFLRQEFYQSLTFKEAELNKLESLPNFFTAHAMMISNIDNVPEFSTVKEWVVNAKQGLKNSSSLY